MTKPTGVWTGIDVLAREGFAELRGSRVGLVTNHTGLTRNGHATTDVLSEALGVALAALFGPEHGIRGEQDEDVADAADPKTGLPIYSLFGARTRPGAEQIAGLDTLVFDIQDIGCRFYTYLSTLSHVLEAADTEGLRVVVLDRPNPINGMTVEGPLADGDKLSFVACHLIPIRHGLTLGELANLMHAEKRLTCPLTVILRGLAAFGLVRCHRPALDKPLPNMRRLSAAALYPGVGLLEMTNVSVGRGTDTPFEVLGAPYIDPRPFAAALNEQRLPGVRFIPLRFTPTASAFAGQSCGGVQLLLTDRDALNAVQVGLTLALTLRCVYPDEWQPQKLMTLLVNQFAYDAVVASRSYEEMADGWTEDLAAFAARTQPHQLY